MDNSKKVRSYEDLVVWQRSMDPAFDIFIESDHGSFSKDHALKDQIRRSANSIPSNISEGWARFSRKEFARFLSVANGSVAEVGTQIHLARGYGHIGENKAEKMLIMYDDVSRMILSLRKRVVEQSETNKMGR
jgi:four helix bundle protein